MSDHGTVETRNQPVAKQSSTLKMTVMFVAVVVLSCGRRLPAVKYPTVSEWGIQQRTLMSKHLQTLEGHGQAGLVDSLVRQGSLKHPRCITTMQHVDRACFVPKDRQDVAYRESPEPIGCGQTISAPVMHAHALELLEDKLRPGSKALDVGSGSGYLTACMALMVRPGGWVLGIEVVPELAAWSAANIPRACPELAHDTSCWSVRAGNALEEALLHDGPFDAIHVGAAAEQLHQLFIDSLSPGGRMVIPVGPPRYYQTLMRVTKDERGRVIKEKYMDVVYVPLHPPGSTGHEHRKRH